MLLINCTKFSKLFTSLIGSDRQFHNLIALRKREFLNNSVLECKWINLFGQRAEYEGERKKLWEMLTRLLMILKNIIKAD